MGGRRYWARFRSTSLLEECAFQTQYPSISPARRATDGFMPFPPDIHNSYTTFTHTAYEVRPLLFHTVSGLCWKRLTSGNFRFMAHSSQLIARSS